MSDKKITELPLASAVNASDVSVLVNNGTDYQFAFSSLLQLIGSSLTVGANITFGTTLPQNTAGKNGDVFINTTTASFAQKISEAWTVVYTIPASGSTTDGTVLYGIGTPGSSTGNNNDTYINTGTGIFYKKSAGAWGQVFSMQTGPAGAPGAPGTNGTNGTNGFSVLSGTTNPSNISTGVNGDFYINTTNYTLFGPKTAGNWGAGTSLIGNGVPMGGTIGQIMSKASNDNFDIEWADKFSGLSDDNITDALGYIPEDASNKGIPNGYAGLDGTGKVPSSQLPSYVDDVIEVVNFSSLPATGETGKIYVTIDTNFEYRWSGSTYVRLISSPGSTDALAEGSTNLYFTNTRARSAISATSPILYDNATGTISSQAATAAQNGYLSSTDWTTFNNKQAALSGTGYVKSTAGVISYDSNTYNSGAGTAGYITKYSAANVQAISGLYETAGLLGLGHTSPLTFFHINSGSTVPLRISTTADEVAQYITSNAFGGFRVATTGASSVPYIAFNTGATANGSSMGTQRAYFAYNLNGANTASLGYSSSTSAITYITSGSGVGNVGFGNNVPAYKVDVNGVVNATSFRGAGTDLTGTATGLSIGGNAATVTNGVYTTGNYSNPSWITSLSWAKISSTPTTIAGYGITDFNSLGDAKWLGISATATDATILATTRTIWGQNFNGSANVTGALTTVTDITASGIITAASFTGASAGLTGTANDLTAGTAIHWGGFTAGGGDQDAPWFILSGAHDASVLKFITINDVIDYFDIATNGNLVNNHGNESITGIKTFEYNDSYPSEIPGITMKDAFLRFNIPSSFGGGNMRLSFNIADIGSTVLMGQQGYSAENGDAGGAMILSSTGIALYTNGDSYGATGVYISPTGNVGINMPYGVEHTEPPLYPLHVNGHAHVTERMSAKYFLPTGTPVGSGYTYIGGNEDGTYLSMTTASETVDTDVYLQAVGGGGVSTVEVNSIGGVLVASEEGLKVRNSVNDGLIIRSYGNVSGFGAIYYSGVTPDNGNYSFWTNSSSTVLNGLASSELRVGSNPIIVTSANRATMFKSLKLVNYTVSGLPSGQQGDLAYVSDGGTNINGVTINGGGSYKIPVFHDGSNWLSLLNTGG